MCLSSIAVSGGSELRAVLASLAGAWPLATTTAAIPDSSLHVVEALGKRFETFVEFLASLLYELLCSFYADMFAASYLALPHSVTIFKLMQLFLELLHTVVTALR